MKCQSCDRQATVHITELTEDHQPQEIHLCENCARDYLDQSLAPPSPTLAGALAHQLKISQTAEELARLDQQVCPVCGITFYEFRSSGRLGCPHDYQCFESELEPLIQSIHGETRHAGKRPKRGVPSMSRQTELIQLRRQMKQCIDEEDYERASRLRDEIRTIEQETSQPSQDSKTEPEPDP